MSNSFDERPRIDGAAVETEISSVSIEDASPIHGGIAAEMTTSA